MFLAKFDIPKQKLNRMKISILSLAIFLLAVNMSAQESVKKDSAWKYSGLTSINFSQLSLSNWAAGGENSLSGNAILNLSAHYLKDKTAWDNDLSMGFGLLKQGDALTRKSDDKIDFSSKFGYKASNHWFYSGLFSFKTQFAKGWDNPADANRIKISNFMAPGYANLSFGMDYKPTENFALLLAPVTGKMTFVLDDDLSTAGAFGVDAGKKVRSEFGGFIKVSWTKEIMKNVRFNTKLDLFSNYLKDPQYVDVNWDLLLTFKVNEYISASFVSQLIYDHDIVFNLDTNNDGTIDYTGPKVQLKELFGIGLSYSF